jgi:4-amino-4-deoxy-L-arabinose transferase-like glycosyltransferase
LRRNALLLLLPAALLLALFFAGLGALPLLEPDEGRYTAIPQAMLASGDWVTPRLNGVLYFEKPPLCYWINAASMGIFGFGEFQVRFGSALFGLLGGCLAWLLGRSGGSPKTGTAAAVILATSPLYIVLSHINTLDMVLTGSVGLSLACFWMARESKGTARERWWWWGSAIGAALAVLAKGLIGLVLPGGAVFLYLLLSWDWRLLKRVPWVSGTALFLLVALPWHLLAAARNPGWANFYIVREHFLRYTTPVHERTAPWWFLALVLLAGFLPWTGLLPAAAASLAVPLTRLRKEKSLELYLLAWAFFPVLFFSASQSKLIPYVLPSFLPLAVLAALALGRVEGGGRPDLARAGLLGGALALALAFVPFLAASLGYVEQYSERGVFFPFLFGYAATGFLAACAAGLLVVRSQLSRGFAVLVLASALGFACVWAAAPRVAQDRSNWDAAAALAGLLKPSDAIYAVRYFPQTLAAYLGRPVGYIGPLGELEYGASNLTARERALWFPSYQEFQPIWGSGRTVYLLCDPLSLKKMPENGLKPGREVWRGGKKILLVNR